ncbi:MAG: tetratricopeptide repeat protein [Blastocatellia bacterium]
MAIRRIIVFLLLPTAVVAWRSNQAVSVPKSEASNGRADSAKTHYELGLADMKVGKFDKAAEDFRQAISVQPDFAKAYCKLGEAVHEGHVRRRETQHPKEETDAFEMAIKLDPTLAEAYVGLGETFLPVVPTSEAEKKRRFGEAERYYRDAIAADPRYTDAYQALASLFIFEGNDQRFLDAEKQALLIDPDYKLALGTLEKYSYGEPLRDQVPAIYQEVIAIHPGSGMLQWFLGRSLFDLHRYSEAVEPLKRAVEIDPLNEEAHFDLGRAYVYLGDMTKAEQECSVLKRLALARHISSGLPDSRNLPEQLLSYIKEHESAPSH